MSTLALLVCMFVPGDPAPADGPMPILLPAIDAGAANDRSSPRIPAETAEIRESHGRSTILGNADLNKGRPEVVRFQARVYRMAMCQARYLLGTVHRWTEEPSLLLLTESKSTEHYIRPNTGTVEGLAFLCRFGPYDQATVGRSRSDLLAKVVIPMLRYLVVTHVTGSRKTSDGRPWGDAWQSAHWAQAMGRGAWWVWQDLPEDLRAGTLKVVAHEADRIAATTPPHRIQQDTKAEENAWNSQVLSVAMLLAPRDPRFGLWEQAFQRWTLSALLRPADEQSQVQVDGRSVAEQFTGANLYDDFALENHGFVHPDYMTCFSLSLGCTLDYTLTGRRPPQSLLYNAAGLYENLKWFSMPDGTFVYPNGQDWELFRNPAWTYAHLLMAVYAGDGDAWSLALQGMNAAEKMQARSPSGAVFYPGEYFFASTQHDAMRKMAHEWLLLQTAGPILDRPQPKLGVRCLDSAKVVLHRTPAVVHTLSWGARVMAQCVPYRLDRIVAPDMRSGIGEVFLTGKSRPLPVAVREAKVDHDPQGFQASLVVDHGDHVRARLECVSSAGGVLTLRERLELLQPAALDRIQTGLVAILNNPTWIYERGRRTLNIDAQDHVLPAQSGKVVESSSARRIAIDGVLEIESPRALGIRYIGATTAERGRSTDRLYLNVVAAPDSWETGRCISEYEVRIRCR